MNMQRVQEILNSKDAIQVFHNGNSVWIEDISGNQARVKNLSNNNILEVPIDQLKETY